MSERYRVCEYTEDDETRLGVCEVRYEKDGAPTCVAVASTEVFATLDDLKRGLDRMRAACELPAVKVSGDEPRLPAFAASARPR